MPGVNGSLRWAGAATTAAVLAAVLVGGAVLTGSGTPAGAGVRSLGDEAVSGLAFGRDGDRFVLASGGEEPPVVRRLTAAGRASIVLRDGDRFPGGEIGTVAAIGAHPTSGTLFILDSSASASELRLRAIESRDRRRTLGTWPGAGAGDLAVSPEGTVFVAARCQITRIETNGATSVVAGAPCDAHPAEEDRLTQHPDADGLPATEALLHPSEVAVDGDGQVVFVDHEYALWRIGGDGRLARVLGDCGGCEFSDLVGDPRSGGVYVRVRAGLDDEEVVWRLGRDGARTVVVGRAPGGSEVPRVRETWGRARRPVAPVAVDPSGGLYLRDHESRVMVIDKPDPDPAGRAAVRDRPVVEFEEPLPYRESELTDLAATPDGGLYLAVRDKGGNPAVLDLPRTGGVRPVLVAGDVLPDGTTFARTTPDTGPDEVAVAVDPRSGDLYVTDVPFLGEVYPLGAVRVVSRDGTARTVVPALPPPAQPFLYQLGRLTDVAVDTRSGMLLVTDGCRIVGMDPSSGSAETLAGPTTTGCVDGQPPVAALGPETRADGRPALGARLSVGSLAVGADGRPVFVADGRIRTIAADGTLATVSARPCGRSSCEPVGLAVDPDGGDLYYGELERARLWRLRPGGRPRVVVDFGGRPGRAGPLAEAAASDIGGTPAEVFRVAVDGLGTVHVGGTRRHENNLGSMRRQGPVVVAVQP